MSKPLTLIWLILIQGADDVELTHTSAGGIEMLSQDGSVGYFTSIVGGDDGLDIVGDVGDDDGLGLDNVDDLLCRNSLGWDKWFSKSKLWRGK